MKLRDWLQQAGYTQDEYGRRIGVSQQAIGRYCDERIPPRSIMVRIYCDTCGVVTPNDFYNLPLLTGSNDNFTTTTPNDASGVKVAPMPVNENGTIKSAPTPAEATGGRR